MPEPIHHKPLLIAASLLCVLCAVGLGFIARDIVLGAGGTPLAALSAGIGVVLAAVGLFVLLIRRARRQRRP